MWLINRCKVLLQIIKQWLGIKQEVFYIGSSEVLPAPLPVEEEQRCLLALSGVYEKAGANGITLRHEKAGTNGITEELEKTGANGIIGELEKAGADEMTGVHGKGEPLTREQAKEKLIAHNLRLVVYLAKKFENTGVGVEDLISIGSIGLIKGINTFNPDKNIKLATYASRCIENEILMYLRRNSKTKVEVSFDEPLNVDWDGNELLLSDILGTEDDLIYRDMENEAEMQQLLEAVAKLDEREREIIELRFGINRKNAKEMTQKEVADVLGISQSYISRLEKKIMARLKKEMLRFE